ncbi:MAG: PKD domain-containing protein, partial [Myxococcales bacterium]|nr:PKD domain-containing protein [Myxococcales bacterium]
MRSVTLSGSSRAAAALVVALLGLTACDDDGGSTGSSFETLIVADRVQGNAPLRVAFRARANGPLEAIYTYAWDFDDGMTSAEEEPLHVFAAPGAYQVGVDVSATTGGSGQATLEVEVFPSADLDVAQVQVVPQRAQAGETITVTWGERNTGAPVVGEWEQRVFLSPAQAYDERAVILDVLPHADDPTLEAYAGFERAVTLPAGLITGDWFVGVIADPDENIGDVDRGNNIAFAPFPLTVRNPQQNGPDLTFCGLSVPAFADIPAGRRPTLQQGDQIPVTLCLGNLGDQPVGLASYVLLLSRDDQPDPGDTVVGQRANLPLGSGDRSDYEDLMDIPVDLEPGAWNLIAVADPDDGVPERDESNNVRVLTGGFDVAEPGNVEGLDLVLVSITVEQDRAFWGQSLTGQLRLANRGNLGVERAFPVRVTAEPVDGGSAIPLRSITVPAFAGGADEVFALDLPIDRRIAAGSYRLVAEADPTNATGDVNRANNRRTYQQVVTLGGQPDFDPAASDVTVSAEVVDAG